MNASSVQRMVFATRTVPGRRLARHALYHHPVRRSAARRRAAAVLLAPARLQRRLHGGRAPARVVHRLLAPLLPLGRLLVPRHLPLPRDDSPSYPQGVGWPRRVAAPAQPRLDRRGAPGLAPAPAAGGVRPGADPLPRPADARPEGGLPLAG